MNIPRNVYDITALMIVIQEVEVGRDEIGDGYGRVPGFAGAPKS